MLNFLQALGLFSLPSLNFPYTLGPIYDKLDAKKYSSLEFHIGRREENQKHVLFKGIFLVLFFFYIKEEFLCTM